MIGDLVWYRGQQTRIIGIRFTSGGRVAAIHVERLDSGARHWVTSEPALTAVRRARRLHKE